MRIDALVTRVDKLEAGQLGLHTRMDRLGDDMRERFRVVDERLAKLAA
jgi:hypothetical protein